MKLIVGLGNPGERYACTRHNAGWLIIDSLVNRLKLGEPRIRFQGSFWGTVILRGEKIFLLKPCTYMNLSGLSVLEAVKYYNLDPRDVFVIYDDAALPFGRLRMREAGSAGGQRGMMSVLGALQTLEVPRLRIGIGAPQNGLALPDWVLGRIPKEQKLIFEKIEDVVWNGLTLWLSEGIQKAMAYVNSFQPEKRQ